MTDQTRPTDLVARLRKYLPFTKSARFCLWRYENRDGRKTKIPYNPKNGQRAKSDDPTTFTDFETAARVLEAHKNRFTGIGIRLAGDLCAVDIDHCRNKETGELTPVAREVIEKLSRYTEASPSGEGVHVIFTAPDLAQAVSEATGKPVENVEDLKAAFSSRWKIRTDALEFYAEFTPRYITVTGDVIDGRGGNLSDASPRAEKVTSKLLNILDKYNRRGGTAELNPVEVNQPQPTQVVELSDAELLERIFNAKNGPQVRALWSGDLSRYGDDDSRGDLALASHLAFYTGGDRARTLRLFNTSALAQRDKWKNRPDYREATITKALENMRATYNPGEYYQSKPEDDFHDEGDEDGAASGSTGKTEKKPQKTPEELRAEYLGATAVNDIDEFFGDIRERAATPAISTGFRYLDDALDGGLYEGLYILGGISSVGKTAFILQIADQIAERGKDVLIFSLEMSKFELMARSLSRNTFQLLKQRDGYHRYDSEKFSKLAKTARGISSFDRWERYKREALDLIVEAAERYKKPARNLWLIEGLGTTGVVDTKEARGIRNTVQAHTVYTGAAPVVIVDYLQILEPYSERMTDKQNTDKAVKLLKIMSRDFKTPVIAISSFNRANYKTAVDMEAFKESGAIEYSSDVLIGLQLEGAGKKDFDASTAKRRDPRNIEALILKNRNGATGLTLNYHYYPKYNAYTEYKKREAGEKATTEDVTTEPQPQAQPEAREWGDTL